MLKKPLKSNKHKYNFGEKTFCKPCKKYNSSQKTQNYKKNVNAASKLLGVKILKPINNPIKNIKPKRKEIHRIIIYVQFETSMLKYQIQNP